MDKKQNKPISKEDFLKAVEALKKAEVPPPYYVVIAPP